eukprot:15336699-Ditylum_brightwellii.AAC.1
MIHWKHISNPLLSVLFDDLAISSDWRDPTSLPVRHGSIGALNPCREAEMNYTALQEIMPHCVEVILGWREFLAEVYTPNLDSGKIEVRTQKEDYYKEARTFIEEDCIPDWRISKEQHSAEGRGFSSQIHLQYLIPPNVPSEVCNG